MTKIKSRTKTIRELLANTKYYLDYYQREYVWQSENVTELIGDLTDAFSSNYNPEDTRQKVNGYTDYFLGSIIIYEKDGNRFIIDGQQRLTTLTLLLIYLDRWLEEEGEKSHLFPLIFSENYGKESYNLDIPERASVMDSLRSDDNFFSIKGQSESIRNIKLRYNDIKNNFKLPNNHALLHFIDWLLEKVCLVEITTEDDDSAYTIFETMNDRELSLTPTAMLRGYLLSNIEDSECRNHAIITWRKQVESLQTIGKEEDSEAIKAWLRSQHLGSVSDFEQIGSEFHRWVRNYGSKLGLISSTAFTDFIERDFKFYSGWYYRLREASKSIVPRFEPVYYNAQNSFTLQYPVLLSLLHINDTDEEIHNKIWIGATFLDILIHRRIWNFKSTAQREMVDLMCSIIPKIRGSRCDGLADVLYTILQAETEPFVNNSGFSWHGSNKRKTHLILARMIDYVEVQSGQPSLYPEYIKTGSNGYEIEHIWANHPESYLDEFSHEFEFGEYRNRIGGLLLLPKKNNASYGDLPYDEKCEHYIKENLLAQSLHEKAYQNNPGFKKFIENSSISFCPHSKFKKADLDKCQKLYLRIAERIWNSERLRLPHGQEPDCVPEEEGVNSNQHNNAVWTSEQIRDLVPQERREYYETRYKNKVVRFYIRVAEFQNFIQEKQWGSVLTLKFRRDFCAFYVGNKPIFGVNLYGAPRFCIWITKEEAEGFRNRYEFAAYYPNATYAIYPEDATLDSLFPILEFAYKKQWRN